LLLADSSSRDASATWAPRRAGFGDVIAKVREYLDAGAPLVWAIDPRGRSAAIFRPGGVAQLIDEDGTLDGADVLPGFSVVLRSILPEDE
jgi:Uma2 family endonuclease